MSDLAVRALRALGIGLVVGLVSALVLLVISAVLPGLSINAAFWGTIFGVIAFLLVLLTGSTKL